MRSKQLGGTIRFLFATELALDRVSRHFLTLILFMLALAGCCRSDECQLEGQVRDLPPQAQITRLAQLSDEQLLDFVAWRVAHTHPPGFRYPYSVLLSRAPRIVDPLVSRLGRDKRSLIEMEYVNILSSIAVISPQSLTPAHRVVAFRECNAMFKMAANLCSPLK